MNKQFEDFLLYIENTKRLSKNTVDSYKRDLKSFYAYLEDKGISDVVNVSDTDIMMYNLYLKNNNKSASTISRSLATLRNFYSFLHNNQMIKSNPTININSPKTEKKMPDILTLKEIEDLLAQPNVDSSTGARDKAMLELLYATGIKVTELITLDVQDVNFEFGFVKCRGNKSNQRIIPIGKIAQNALNEYIFTHRINMADESTNALFVNYTGERMSRQGFWKLLKRHTESAKIEKTITPHTLRHSFAVHMIQNGADLKVVQELLGHSDISTTQVYLELSKYNLKEIYNKAHPRA